MTPLSSRQQHADESADALGARRYDYRYPVTAKLIALGILALIPIIVAFFLRTILQPASWNDRLVPLAMALILIVAAAYLAYRQAYFAWTTITVYERGLRLHFWNRQVVVPWSKLGKLYRAPGRMPRWEIVDDDEHPLCELRTSAIGYASSESEAGAARQPKAPTITDAIIEQANLTLYETPFSHYGPTSRGSRTKKKAR